MKKMYLILLPAMLWLVVACNLGTAERKSGNVAGKKIGVLLVNHGSRSATWRQALLDLESRVKDSILDRGIVKEVRTAFMEYNEPSIATRLEEFDSLGFTDVIMVPVFLTVSPHSFDDIPTIIGQKEDPRSMEVLKMDNIRRYTPRAKVHITPLLDFTDILRKNILKRAKDISTHSEQEGLVLIAYGDETYMKEWTELLKSVGEYVKEQKGISEYSYGWCGHVAHYNPDSTTAAILRVLKSRQSAIVIPVLVAHDEAFQIKIIGNGIAKIPEAENRVVYRPDAILPDENIDNWVIDIVTSFTEKL